MRYLFATLFFIQVLVSYAQKADKIETILFKCLNASYNSVDVNLKSELYKLETHLIENGYLNSKSGQAYFDFYTQIVKENEISALINYNQIKGLYKLQPGQYYNSSCLKKLTKLDSNQIKSSKFYNLTLAMLNLKSYKNINPSIVANEIISVLSAADFDNPYYRSIALLTIANTGNLNTGLAIKLTTSQEKKRNYNNFNSLTILLSSTDKIVIDQLEVCQNEMENRIRDLIITNDSTYIIRLQNDRQTSYEFYLKIQTQIKKIYDEIEELKSQEYYGKSYINLTEIEKKEIRKIHPFNVIEE